MEHEEIVNMIWGNLADISNKCSGWKFHVLREVLFDLSKEKRPEKVIKILLEHNIIDSKGKLTSNYRLLNEEDTIEFEAGVKELIHLGVINDIKNKRMEQKEIDPGIFGIIKRLKEMSFVDSIIECCSGHADHDGVLRIVLHVNNPKTKIFYTNFSNLERSNDFCVVRTELDESFYERPRFMKYFAKKKLKDYDELSSNGKLEINYKIRILMKKEVKNLELKEKFQQEALVRFWEAFSRILNEFEYSPIHEKLNRELFEVMNH